MDCFFKYFIKVYQIGDDMIYLGHRDHDKQKIIFDYCKNNNISKLFILAPKKFYFDYDCEFVDWCEIIQYKTYYQLLKDIDNNTLIIINECLRKQNRYDLTYNCIRLFLNQTKHKIIFQYLPIIDGRADFMILFDFDTGSKWKKEQFNKSLFVNSKIVFNNVNIKLNRIDIKTSYKLEKEYVKKKWNLINNIGLKDPNVIPRNLYLLSGKEKIKHVDDSIYYIGRNNRFKMKNFQTYKDKEYGKNYIVFELCHNFIDFIDFLTLSAQVNIDVFVSDLRVDSWYLERYHEWIKEMQDVYAELQ